VQSPKADVGPEGTPKASKRKTNKAEGVEGARMHSGLPSTAQKKPATTLFQVT